MKGGVRKGKVSRLFGGPAARPREGRTRRWHRATTPPGHPVTLFVDLVDLPHLVLELADLLLYHHDLLRADFDALLAVLVFGARPAVVRLDLSALKDASCYYLASAPAPADSPELADSEVASYLDGLLARDARAGGSACLFKRNYSE